MKHDIKVIRNSIISCMVVLILFGIGLFGLTKLTERKEATIKYHDFYEQKEPFDVLLYGTSHMINGVLPMEMWKEYGIVSYNLGGHDNPIPTTYWVMMNSFDYHVPKAVVIDCCYLEMEGRHSNQIEMLHQSMDAFPLTKTKVAAIRDILSGAGRKTEFLWNFVVYHDRWQELTWEDISPTYSLEKGAESNVWVAEPRHYEYVDKTSKIGETEGVIYLERMIEECQKRNVKVLLTYLPFSALPEQQAPSNTMVDIASKYGVDYLSFHDLLNDVNLETDCADKESHLNPSGAKKMSSVIGQYLKEQYQIPDHRNQVEYAHWDTDYVKYEAEKESRLLNSTNLYIYCMLLYKEPYHLEIVGPKAMLQDNTFINLLDNLGGQVTVETDQNVSAITTKLYKENESTVYQTREWDW